MFEIAKPGKIVGVRKNYLKELIKLILANNLYNIHVKNSSA